MGEVRGEIDEMGEGGKKLVRIFSISNWVMATGVYTHVKIH